MYINRTCSTVKIKTYNEYTHERESINDIGAYDESGKPVWKFLDQSLRPVWGYYGQLRRMVGTIHVRVQPKMIL